MIYYARENQELLDHLTATANLARVFASVFGCGNTAYLSGLVHDLGKYTHAFQNYLKRSLEGENVTRGEVIHALQGARFTKETIKEPLVADIIGNAIATHHGGLFDNITDGERTLSVKTNKGEDKLHYAEAVNAFCPKINEAELKTEILNFCQTSQTKELNTYFMLHFLTKAVYSCLVDADRCNSAGLTINDTIPDWVALIQQLESYLSFFSDESGIDKVRKSISEQCRQAGCRQQGIYTLSVPTGGGKTLSSLRFALEHAREHNLKRIIYIIPYLSILDQTAAKMREVFSDDNGELILEHHSNIELLEEDDAEEQYRLLTSRWESPIILTTMVQFLETVYSNKASKLRKFHNMSEAVLIFDEIQALPIKCVHLFNEAVNFLQTFGRSTILLCTATQPHLHKTEHPVLLSDEPEIVSITSDELNIFERVRIEVKTQSVMDHEQIATLVKAQIGQGKSTLVILNTKSDAHGVYEQCKPIACEKAFLTTDLCPAHRLNILERLRKNLNPKTKRVTLCVSTQLIEAGVDVSFDCVIRAAAGFDSIIQAAGRCNRNKENTTSQTVFVVDVQGENLSRLQEIKEGKSVTARVLRENQGKDVLSDEVINRYYQYYFYDQQRGRNIGKMDFMTKDGNTTIYSLLSNNPLGMFAYRNRNNKEYAGLPSAFRTASDEFSVIDGAQIGIVVPYGDAMKLVDAFYSCYNPKQKMRILKQLQKYTVSVYIQAFDGLKQAVSIVDDTFYLLSPDYYDVAEQGLKREAMFSLLHV
ncbi:MAG: CRISPR-associated helicase Cas3' [Desulfuromusa sp.]|nr:CRISPR-associated helicase Cas3' [Desulfuromusa sp.]